MTKASQAKLTISAIALLALPACEFMDEVLPAPEPAGQYQIPDDVGVYGFNAYAEGLGHAWCARVQDGSELWAVCYD